MLILREWMNAGTQLLIRRNKYNDYWLIDLYFLTNPNVPVRNMWRFSMNCIRWLDLYQFWRVYNKVAYYKNGLVLIDIILFISNKMRRCIYLNFSKINKAFVDAPSEYIHKIEPTQYFEKLKPFRVIDLGGNVIAKEYDTIPKDIMNKILDVMVTVIP